MTHDLGYLLKRIEEAPFRTEPFEHLWIDDFFEPGDFEEIISSSEVDLGHARHDVDLIDRLHGIGYEAIRFPGSSTSVQSYLQRRVDPASQKNLNKDTTENFGMTFRLRSGRPGSIIEAVLDLLSSEEFWSTLARKFDIDIGAVTREAGIQKYLDGYEISPHPDIRRKALTFMTNINPSPDSERLEFHTSYLTFTPARKYVQDRWETDPTIERCWVPWDWCEVKAQQRRNNSFVAFSPSHNTLHAVKASYDHLATQRTQIYGNLWQETASLPYPTWRDFDDWAKRGSDPDEPIRPA